MKRSTPLKRGKPLKRKGLPRHTKPMARKARQTPRAFRQRRDPRYASYVRGLSCILAGAPISLPFSGADVSLGLAWRGFEHRCWGPIDPAHIGQHRATGAPDRGVLLPLCRAAHQFYDERRLSFYRVTASGPTELAQRAEQLYGEYQRETGAQ